MEKWEADARRPRGMALKRFAIVQTAPFAGAGLSVGRDAWRVVGPPDRSGLLR